jgi:sec-independent protein translocase protein TatA
VVGDILQPSHLLFILVIALIVLGPKRLPEAGKSLGKGLRDFRSALRDNDPREELSQLNEHTMAPIQAAPPAPATQAVGAAPESAEKAPEPVAAAAPAQQGQTVEQYESD